MRTESQEMQPDHDFVMVPWDMNLIASDNNIVLPQEAANEVKTLLSAAETNLRSLDKEISKIGSDRVTLHARRLQAISQISIYQIAVAAHRKLPGEILSLIFSYAAAAHLSIPWKRTHTQLIIGQVCKKWREISHGNPLLWSNISWSGGYYSIKNSTSLKALALILSRTASAPLTIRFRSRPGPSQSKIASLIFSQHIGQLKSVTTDLCTASSLGSFLTLPPGRVDMLEHIDLQLEQDKQWEGIRISVFQDAPNLRKVKLKLARNFDPHSLNLPWARLTDLSLLAATRTMNNFGVDTILRQSQSLVNLTLEIKESEDFHSDPDNGAVLLQHLGLFALDLCSHHSDLLQHLVMPNLTKILLKSCARLSWKPEYTIHVTHSGILHTISIDIPIPTNAIDAILMHNPYLVELRLPSSDLFSEASLTGMAEGVLVPMLEVIECYIPKHGRGGLYAYLNLVSARRSLGAAVCSDIPRLEFRLHTQLNWKVAISLSRGSRSQENRPPDDWEMVKRVQDFIADGWSIKYR